jgi:SEC-C motif-containing protein
VTYDSPVSTSLAGSADLKMADRDCPCGAAAPKRQASAKAPRFAECCGQYLSGAAVPPTALELMRSRYSAYVLGDAGYLRATWDASTCPADLALDLEAPDAPRWLGLQIKRFEALDDTHAIVEFVARFKAGARGHRLHEVSRFTLGTDGRWRYVDGDVSEQ